MTTCTRCGLKRGRKEDPAVETPRCDRCFELTNEQLVAAQTLMRGKEIDWDDGTITMSINTFVGLALANA